MQFCFVCDAEADGDVCPTCGRPTWTEEGASGSLDGNGSGNVDAGASTTELTDTADLTEPTRAPVFAPADAEADTIRLGDTARRELPRRGIVVGAGLILAIVFVSVLQLPSGLDETAQPDLTVPPTAPPTTPPSTIPQTVPTTTPPVRPYRIPEPTTVYAMNVGESRYHSLLDGEEIVAAEPVLDVLADGRLVVLADRARGVVAIGELTFEIDPALDVATAIAVSPDGTTVAFLSGDTFGMVLPDGSLVDGLAAPGADRLVWSPDSQRLALASGSSYSVWLRSGTEPIIDGATGQVLALAGVGTLVWTGAQLEVRGDDGTLLRAWREVFVPFDLGPPPAEFSPSGDRIAIEATIEDNKGLWVLSTFGSDRERLGPAQHPSRLFTWSGSGDGLYLVSGGSLKVWPTDPDLDLSIIGPGPGAPGRTPQRLRVYDPAIRPSLTIGLLEGSLMSMVTTMKSEPLGEAVALLPGISRRTYTVARPTETGFTLTIEGPDLTQGFVVGTVATEIVPDELVIVWNDRLSEQIAEDFGLPAPVDQLAGIVLMVTNGEILAASLPGPGSVAVPRVVADGYGLALSSSGDRLLYTDGERVYELSATGRAEIADIGELGLDRIDSLAVGGSTVFVAGTRAEDGDQRVAVVQAPDRTLFVNDGETISLLIDAETPALAIVLTQDSGIAETVVAFADGGAGRFAGGALSFAPSGHWVLVASDDGVSAVSTRGRGVVALDLARPDAAVWVDG